MLKLIAVSYLLVKSCFFFFQENNILYILQNCIYLKIIKKLE